MLTQYFGTYEQPDSRIDSVVLRATSMKHVKISELILSTMGGGGGTGDEKLLCFCGKVDLYRKPPTTIPQPPHAGGQKTVAQVS